jgi:tetratricopeptide (TPR) repeat protein
LADLLATTQAIDPALIEIEKLNQSDPRNLDVLKVYASILEFEKSFDQAIKLRKQIVKYDPWNALNYLDLGRNYKSIEDWANMESMRLKVISFAPQSNEAKLASVELVKQ